ncbi:MAG TPA: EamA family transporter [Actinomycetota bacterium]
MARVPFRAKVWLALLSIYILWGSTYLAIRIAIETLPGLLMAGVRFTLAGLAMYAIGISRGDRAGDRPTPAQWRAAFVIGAALAAGGNGFVVLAEERIASGAAALIVATVPLWVALFEWVRHGARLSKPVIGAMLAGFGGVAILARPGEGSIDSVGALMVVAATVFWAAGSVYARRADLPRRPVVSTGMEMIGGGLTLLLAGTLIGEWGEVEVAAFSRSSLLAMGYLTVFGSIVGFSAYVWLLRNVESSLATTYAYVNPFIAVMLGAVIADEVITGTILLAGAIIVVSVAIIVSRTSRRARAAEELPPEAGMGAEEVVV